MFIGSPVKADKNSLVRMGRRLKKNNVAVDIVNFGEDAENTEKLEGFISAVNSNDNNRYLTSFLFSLFSLLSSLHSLPLSSPLLFLTLLSSLLPSPLLPLFLLTPSLFTTLFRFSFCFSQIAIVFRSHLVNIPPGPHILSDALVASPIICGEGGVGVAGMDGFGVDANLDPELAEVRCTVVSLS